MFPNLIAFYFFLEIMAFLAVVYMHLVKTNKSLIRAYMLQSLVVGILLITSGIMNDETSLVWIGILTLVIKAGVAPLFFSRLKARFDAYFTPNNYLSTPLTLVVLMGLTLAAYSEAFQPLESYFIEAYGFLPLGLSMIFISIFLMINRRGAFSQMLGILSLENSILLLATFIGTKQPVAIEMGIIFDIVIWMIIAQVFISMIYKQFGSLNVTQLKKLIEE